MPLYLVTCVCDEGVGKNSFRVVDAASRLAVAESMLRYPAYWGNYLERSYLLELVRVRDRRWSAEEFLRKIDATGVDGDSRYQVAIHEIAQIEPCEPTGWFRGS